MTFVFLILVLTKNMNKVRNRVEPSLRTVACCLLMVKLKNKNQCRKRYRFLASQLHVRIRTHGDMVELIILLIYLLS